MGRHVTSVILAAVVAGTCVQTGAAAWFTYGCNSARTFQSDLPGPGETIALVLSSPTKMPVGTLLTISNDGSVYQFRSVLRGAAAKGIPIFENGGLYDEGVRGALLTDSGILLWTGWCDSGADLRVFNYLGYETDERRICFADGTVAPAPLRYPALTPDGSIIAAAGYSGEPVLMSFNQDGNVNWVNDRFNISYYIAVSVDGLIVTVPEKGSYSPEITCFSSEGDQLWSVNYVGYPGPPMIDDARGRVLLRRQNPISAMLGLLCLDIESGEVLWEYGLDGCTIPAHDRFDYPLALDTQRGITYAVWLDDINHPREKTLTAIDENGSLLWSRTWLKWGETTFRMASHPIIDCDGYVYMNGMRSCPDETGRSSVTSIVEVLRDDGELVAVTEYPFTRAGGYFPVLEVAKPCIGERGRLYLVDGDAEYGGKAHLYAFGRPDDPLLSDYRPVIISAGLGATDLAADGSHVKISAEVWHPLGYKYIDRVEARIKGENDWYSLAHVEDGTYAITLVVADGGVNAGQHLVEIVAYDTAGRPSLTWPYLSIEEGSK